MIRKVFLFLLFTTCFIKSSLAQEVPASEMCDFLNNKTGHYSYYYWDLFLEKYYYDVLLMGDTETACIEENYVWNKHEGYNQFYAVRSGCESKVVNLESLKSELKEGFQTWKKEPTLAEVKAYFEVEMDGREHSPIYKIDIHDRVENSYRNDSNVLQRAATMADYCVRDHHFPYDVCDENNMLIATIDISVGDVSNREIYNVSLKAEVDNYRPSSLYIYEKDNYRNVISTEDIY
jgi:hypothetical protein